MKVAGPPAWLALPVIFLLVAVILAGPAEMVGRCFGGLEPLTAYRYDLIGSLLGIGVFTLMSFLRAPSVVWGLVASLVFLALATGVRMRVVYAVSAVVVVGMLLSETLTAGVSWSPYYKVQTHHSNSGPGALSIWVNGVPHQTMAKASWRLLHAPEQYGTPYKRLPKDTLDNVLVVGAGSGSDVAIALRKGAKHVDAVEIDPRILQLGKQRNPDHAYQDARVTTHTNDGRAFLQSTHTKYDLILFALPDSLALVNGASQIRLESFLFTQQALESVRAHLRPDGGFAMYNYYRENWLIDRLAGTAATVFGHTPCVDNFTSHQAVVAVALHESNQVCGAAYTPSTKVIAPATDNAPFLYFKGGMIPWLYVWTLLGVVLVSLLLVRTVGGPFREMRPYADLFFMGAAFLLLETKNVASFALMFGTTWFVNALVFTGVLVIVLAAVETTRRFRTPPLPVVFAGIAASLALSWVIQPGVLLGLSFWPRSAQRQRPGVPADLPGERRVRQEVLRHQRLPVGVRGEPARLDRGRVPGVRGAAHRVRQPADPRRVALPRRLRADPTCRSDAQPGLTREFRGSSRRPVVRRWRGQPVRHRQAPAGPSGALVRSGAGHVKPPTFRA